jgi:hypothetical protein
MSNQGAAAAKRQGVEETPMQSFERELMERYPGRVIKRFDMPARVREARAVYIKEITSKDELEAARMADATMTTIEKESLQLAIEARRKESMRLSIVGVVPRKEPIQYRHIGAVPFVEMNDWSAKAMTCLRLYYGEVNGITDEEILEGLKGQRTIGESAAPTNATPPQASTES